MKKAEVKFENITKKFNETTAVDNVSCNFEAGTLTTLLGPSGCGKTTSLRIIAGLERATSGKILVYNEDVTILPATDRDVSMVFQSYALFPHMSVIENVSYGLKMINVNKEEYIEKALETLKLVNLEGYENRMPSELSGGQQQRVAVARSLVFDPDLVLMDEPLGALDKNLREQMQYEIKHLHESLGLTVVYVTHDQTEALTMSNRIAVFDDGVVQQCASPENLYEKPENAFVANFIGENNRLMGTVESIDGEKATVKTDSGDIVVASKVNVNKAGERATLSLRPERIMVSPSKGKTPNTYSAKVEELIYHGDHIRTRFNVCGHDDFIVKIPNSIGNVSLEEGKVVNIGWMSEDCLALDG